jgi:chromosome segregation ATPase
MEQVPLKTITVREAAHALNLTKRAVMYRLDGGKLKGIRVKTSHGLEEWRIYPNKEILEGLQRLAQSNPVNEPSREPLTEEEIDAEEVDFEDESIVDDQRWQDTERDRIKIIAEEFMKPLLERIDNQSRALMQKEQELLTLKVKLLPDLEKRAEEERKTAELKQMEIAALNKQIESLKEASSTTESTISHLEKAAQETDLLRVRKTELESIVPELEGKLEKETSERRRLESELESVVPELQEKLDQEAAERLRLENELKSAVPELQEKLDKEAAERLKLETELKKLQEESQKPWWKKLFESPSA